MESGICRVNKILSHVSGKSVTIRNKVRMLISSKKPDLISTIRRSAFQKVSSFIHFRNKMLNTHTLNTLTSMMWVSNFFKCFIDSIKIWEFTTKMTNFLLGVSCISRTPSQSFKFIKITNEWVWDLFCFD